MNLRLIRNEYRSDGIFGKMFVETGQPLCVTLEHAYLIKGNWSAKIPPGVYICQRRISPHFGYEVFELLNVPNCTYIEIHVGNFLQDSEGCILVGEAVSEQPNGSQAITNSRIAFTQFMRLQSGVDNFQLTVS